MQQIRETLVRYVHEEQLATGRKGAGSQATPPVVAPAPVARQQPRINRIKEVLRRIPILSPLLVTAYRTMKLPGRVALIVRQLQTVHELQLGLTNLHERIDALTWHVSALLERQASAARASEIAARQTQTIEGRFNEVAKAASAASRLSETAARLESRLSEFSTRQEGTQWSVAETVKLLSLLHEKTDQYQKDLQARLAAIKPIFYGGENLIISRVDDLIMAFPSEEWRLPIYQILVGPLEPGLVAIMKTVIHEGDVVIDIGANVGTYTLLALQAIGSRGLVVGYEPTPRVFDVLKNNVRINGFLETGRVDLRRKAVSDGRAASATFYVSRNSLMNSLYGEDTSSPTGSTTIDVESVSLDRDLAHLDRVDVVKIDAEGAEPVILRGMQQLIRRSTGITIFIEFAPVHLVRAKEDPQAFLDELRAQGFAIEEVCEPSGALRTPTDEELCNCFSVNLMLRKSVR